VICESKLNNSLLAACSIVEFYFSDANFPYDKFLYTLSLRDTLGWVDLPVLLSFKRMKGPFTQVYGDQFIIGCLREREVKMQGVKDGASRVGSLCVISEDGKKIRRREKELVKDVTAWDRTVYVVSLGAAWRSYTTDTDTMNNLFCLFRSFSLFETLLLAFLATR
jgi:lupus La protein